MIAMDNLEPKDFTQFCRLCLTPPSADQKLDLSTIYDEIESLSYSECFTICTGIDLRHNVGNVPCNLCKDCGLELQVAYDFYKKVEESKKLLETFTEENQKQPTKLIKPKEEHPLQQEDVYDLAEESLKLNQSLDMTQCLEASNLETATAEVHNDTVSLVTLEECAFIQEVEDEMEHVENELTDHVADVTMMMMAHSETTDDADNQTEDELTNELPDELEYETIEELEDDEDVETHMNDSKTNTETSVDIMSNAELVSYSVVTVTQDNTKWCGTSPTPKHPSGQYRCCYCDKVFKLYSRMMTHQRIHEANRPKYMCNICNRIYASKQALRVHHRTTHTETSPAECHFCGKRFAIAKLLEVHLRYHTGDFPFQCDLCEKKFAQRSHLNTHKKVQHNQARFLCSHTNCGKLFTSCHSLRNHEYKHSGMPFECAYCQRGFPAKAKLKVHIRNKHEQELTLEQLEDMRKFFVSRSKPNLVQIQEVDVQE